MKEENKLYHSPRALPNAPRGQKAARGPLRFQLHVRRVVVLYDLLLPMDLTRHPQLGRSRLSYESGDMIFDTSASNCSSPTRTTMKKGHASGEVLSSKQGLRMGRREASGSSPSSHVYAYE
jgi:hypothetical protein